MLQWTEISKKCCLFCCVTVNMLILYKLYFHKSFSNLRCLYHGLIQNANRWLVKLHVDCLTVNCAPFYPPKIDQTSIPAKCLRALLCLFSPNIIGQSSCRILTTHTKTRPILHDDCSIRLGENRLDQTLSIGILELYELSTFLGLKNALLNFLNLLQSNNSFL